MVRGANTPLIDRCAALCRTAEIAHVRLRPMPHPQEDFGSDKEIGKIKKGSRYCISLQPGIWKAQYLHDVCKNGESPYHAETHGSARAGRYKGTLLSTRIPAITHHNYYLKKKAQDWAISWVMKNVPPELWPTAAKARR